MKLLYGKTIAEKIYKDILAKPFVSKKTLAIILIGDNSASEIYIKNKRIALQKLGGETIIFRLEEKINQEEVENLIIKLNSDKSIDGIILQLPIADQFNKNQLLSLIDKNKDVDGLNPYNLGNLIQSDYSKSYIPATPFAVMKILSFYQIDIEIKNIVIINNSLLFGKPLAMLLSNKLATVTICNHKTQNIKDFTLKADIVISAVGKAKIWDKSFLTNNQTIIDVGISKDEDGKISGDFDFDSIQNLDINYTPVPGGVGPVTIACLLHNLYS